MTTKEKVPRRKRSLLELATEVGNVSKACRMMGYLRQQFYEIRRNFQTYSAEGLLDRPAGARAPYPNRVGAAIDPPQKRLRINLAIVPNSCLLQLCLDTVSMDRVTSLHLARRSSDPPPEIGSLRHLMPDRMLRDHRTAPPRSEISGAVGRRNWHGTDCHAQAQKCWLPLQSHTYSGWGFRRRYCSETSCYYSR
jgi:hypothetical protein